MLGVIGFFLKKFSNDIRDKEMDLSRAIEKLNTTVETLATVMHRMETRIASEYVRKDDHKEDIANLKSDLRMTETRLMDVIRQHHK